MMWGYVQSCCSATNNAVAYRYYTDDIIDNVESVEVSSIAEQIEIVSTTEIIEIDSAANVEEKITMTEDIEDSTEDCICG